MSKSIVIATGNKGKLKEFEFILKDTYDQILSLKDFENLPEIIEDGNSFKENAFIKANIISKHLNADTIADDSGLVVDALGGAPGIYSARYAGEDSSDDENTEKLLSEMQNHENRKAKFVCCIAFVSPDGQQEYFEGECEGLITKAKIGSEGFGYDPVFYLSHYEKTMAEIAPEIKNKISHRAKALEKLLKHFK